MASKTTAPAASTIKVRTGQALPAATRQRAESTDELAPVVQESFDTQTATFLDGISVVPNEDGKSDADDIERRLRAIAGRTDNMGMKIRRVTEDGVPVPRDLATGTVTVAFQAVPRRGYRSQKNG